MAYKVHLIFFQGRMLYREKFLQHQLDTLRLDIENIRKLHCKKKM